MTILLPREVDPRSVLMESGGPPWWSEFVDLKLELGIATHTNQNVVGLWDHAHWDRPLTGTWSGQEPDWYTVNPCNLLDLSITRGRERWIDRFGASSAGFSFQDPDGQLSWDSGDDPDLLEVRPGREVRVSARIVPDGNEYPLWRGFIENIEDEFSPNNVPVAKFTAQDGYAQLSHIDPGEGPIVGAGETSDQRVHRLLDIAEWPDEWRDIQFGLITVQGTNTARPIADDIGITADSEGGAAFSDREGKLCYRNRDWLRTDPHAQEVQVTIGGPEQDVCAASYRTERNGNDIANDIGVARAGGTIQRFVNEDSIATYRRRTYSRTDFVCQTDAQVATLGRRILQARSGGQVRLPSLTITPTDNVAEWEFVCAVDFGWKIEVHYPAEAGLDSNEWVRTMFVQGVSHRITPSGWETELRVDDAVVGMADTWDGKRGWDVALWSEVV